MCQCTLCIWPISFLFQIHSVLMPFGLKRLSTASHPIYPLTGAIKEFGGFEAILFVDCRTQEMFKQIYLGKIRQLILFLSCTQKNGVKPQNSFIDPSKAHNTGLVHLLLQCMQYAVYVLPSGINLVFPQHLFKRISITYLDYVFITWNHIPLAFFS